MKSKKILINLIILLLCVFTFFGCARVDMMRIVDGNYVITDKIVIEFDETKIVAGGKTVAEVVSKLDRDFDILKNAIDDWKKEFEEPYPDVYEELKLGVLCGKENSIKNKYSLYITFSSSKMFYLFYGYYPEEECTIDGVIADVGPFLDKIAREEYDIEDMGWFLTKYSMLLSDNPVDKIKEFTYNDRNICNDYSEYTGYTIEDVELNQIFTYPDDRLYSNSDFSEVEGGLSFFGWELNNKSEGYALELYRLLPKPAAWYVLGIVLSALTVVILLVVYFVKYRKQIKVKISKQDAEDE